MIPYKALNRHVIVEVKKFKKEEIKEKLKHVEGSNLILAPETDKLKDVTDTETTSQTVGKVVDMGPLANRFDDGSPMGCADSVCIGDIVHIQRYGSVRLKSSDSDEFEYWVVKDKDLLVKDIKEVV